MEIHNEINEWFNNLKMQELAIHNEQIKEYLSKFDVIDCRNDKFYKVWSIKNDKKGFPHFLIYDNNQWKWQSAKHFKPIQEA